jgi:DNA-binding transcriptional ArsR family regulator
MVGHRPLRQRVPEEGVSDSVSLDRLVELAELLGAMAQRGVAEHGLTRARAAPLWPLFHAGPMTRRAPAARLGVTPRSVTGLLDALETDGLVASCSGTSVRGHARHTADGRARPRVCGMIRRTGPGVRRRSPWSESATWAFVSDSLPLVETYRLDGGRALEALGDPTRRAIFESLVTAPKPVRELADLLPVSRPAVSQHLKVLKEAGLVADQPEGTRRVYRVQPAAIAAMREYLDRMWDHALAAAVEQDAEADTEQDATQPPKPVEGPKS